MGFLKTFWKGMGKLKGPSRIVEGKKRYGVGSNGKIEGRWPLP